MRNKVMSIPPHDDYLATSIFQLTLAIYDLIDVINKTAPIQHKEEK